MEEHVDGLVKAFSSDFYVDEDAARSAVRSRRIFNLMHLTSGVKVDLIVRKDSEYRHVEFARRKSVDGRSIDLDYKPRRPDPFKASLGSRRELGATKA